MHGQAWRAGAWLLGLAAPAAAQTYQYQDSLLPQGSPANDSYTENVDFGDVDLDGDWDVILADGGDQGNDQNRVWINAGGAQGGTLGQLVDETAVRFPQVLDDSRDIEFADVDGDGDLDVYSSNTSQITAQTNRWWTNVGGIQGGAVGFYVDETQSRWIGIGGPGSSVPPSAVLPGGGFLDWSCDCDFADLDDDGDLDLVHSSYGGAFAGQVPTRLYLNDATGHFAEFNPSGFQLSQDIIVDGDPGLWCQGVQKANTTDATGAFCDVASTALDVELADVDGDFDVDLVHGARKEMPRLFENRLAPTGALAFRDVTGIAFPPGYATGNGHYEQELGDLDGDGDLDLYGLNWQTSVGNWTDVTFENDGSGFFVNMKLLPNSLDDDTEGDFVDYDNDGDLDLFVASFSGWDRLYRNDPVGGSFQFTESSGTELPVQSSESLDGEVCDLDGDGDYDILVAIDKGKPNRLFANVSQVPDTTAPSIPKVEAVPPSVVAGAQPRSVRAHVFDNAPYYVTAFATVLLETKVDGTSIPDATMVCAGGQVFRGELPGNLAGGVTYRLRAADEHGNVGASIVQSFASSPATPFQFPFGVGSPGSQGVPSLRALSVPMASTTLHLAGEGSPVGSTWFFLITDQPLAAPLYLPGLGNLNVTGTTILLTSGVTQSVQGALLSIPLDATLPSGASIFVQFFALDGVGGDLLSASPGLEVVTQ